MSQTSPAGVEYVRLAAPNLIEGMVRLEKGDVSTLLLKREGREIGALNLAGECGGWRRFTIPIAPEEVARGFSWYTVERSEPARQVGKVVYALGDVSDTEGPWPRTPSSIPADRVCLAAPHPDDEALIFGGAALRHREEGAAIDIVWLTSGEVGGGADVRRREALAVAAALGARESAFFDFPDGGLEGYAEAAIQRMVDWFEQSKPQVVYSPSPDDWHPDHVAAAHIVGAAAEISGIPELIAFGEYYRPILPNLIVDMGDLVEEKRRLCELHHSQCQVHAYTHVALGLNAYRGLMLEPREGSAEAYFVAKVRNSVSPVEAFRRAQNRSLHGKRPNRPSSTRRSRQEASDLEQRNQPELDLSVLTYESEPDIRPFLESLLEQEYPTERIHLRIRDQSDSNACWSTLEAAVSQWRDRFASFEIERGKNLGFGAGHNRNFGKGQAEWLLCSNVDLTFERTSIVEAINAATRAPDRDAAWEFRQKPYEHPKIYDPVSLSADWCSAACILMRRQAFEEVKGFDEVLFLYGEDVDLSFRLRAHGWRLRYCPHASVVHGSDRNPEDPTRAQDRHQGYGDFLVRLRYGNLVDIRRGFARLRHGVEIAKGFRIPWPIRLKEWVALAGRSLRVVGSRPRFHYPLRHSASRIFEDPDVIARVKSIADPAAEVETSWTKRQGRFEESTFCFHGLGPTVKLEDRSLEWNPLVSIIVRTTGLRPGFLEEALQSLANQTWDRIQAIVVQDGAESMRATAAAFEPLFESLEFISIPQSGRSAAGNAGLKAARGELVGFLDDDDLLLASHVEMLATKLGNQPERPAVTAFAIEVPTEVICPIMPVYREFKLRNRVREPFSSSLILSKNQFPIQAHLFRRELYLQHGGMDESLDALEDWDLWIRYSRSGPFATVPKSTSLYRVPANPEEDRSRKEWLGNAFHAIFAKHPEVESAPRSP